MTFETRKTIILSEKNNDAPSSCWIARCDKRFRFLTKLFDETIVNRVWCRLGCIRLGCKPSRLTQSLYSSLISSYLLIDKIKIGSKVGIISLRRNRIFCQNSCTIASEMAEID